jgi:hypothetical protein
LLLNRLPLNTQTKDHAAAILKIVPLHVPTVGPSDGSGDGEPQSQVVLVGVLIPQTDHGFIQL